MLGYADDEIEANLGAWERLLHPDDQAQAVEMNMSVTRGARSYEGEFRLRHKDGRYIHVLSRGLPDSPRTRWTRRARRRHPLRSHRAAPRRSGPARERGTADAGLRRRAGRGLGLGSRNRRGGVLAAVEGDARLRRRRSRAGHQRLGAPAASRRHASRAAGQRSGRPRRTDRTKGSSGSATRPAITSTSSRAAFRCAASPAGPPCASSARTSTSPNGSRRRRCCAGRTRSSKAGSASAPPNWRRPMPRCARKWASGRAPNGPAPSCSAG